MNLNPLEGEKCLYSIKDLYKKDNRFYLNETDILSYYGNYERLLRSITDKISWKICVSNNDYSGDYFFVGEDDEKGIYFSTGGYGSCSACDEYYACSSFEDFEHLRDSIKRNIRKFDNIEEFINYIITFSKDNWYYYSDDWNEFKAELKRVYSIKIGEEELSF